MKLIELRSLKDLSLIVFINKWLLVSAIILFVVWFIIFKILKNKIHLPFSDFEINEASIGVGSGSITINPNREDRQIAYKLWVELSTRKIGLPIDFDHDVILEIFNSWYDFFRITRELIKTIPVSKIRNSDSTKEIVKVSIAVLNEGLRPILTKWQARFRKWYDNEMKVKKNNKYHPQDIQKKFPQYEEMKKEINSLNKKMMKYREMLYDLALK